MGRQLTARYSGSDDRIELPCLMNRNGEFKLSLLRTSLHIFSKSSFVHYWDVSFGRALMVET